MDNLNLDYHNDNDESEDLEDLENLEDFENIDDDDEINNEQIAKDKPYYRLLRVF
jgi:hypothetical protein